MLRKGLMKRRRVNLNLLRNLTRMQLVLSFYRRTTVRPRTKKKLRKSSRIASRLMLKRLLSRS